MAATEAAVQMHMNQTAATPHPPAPSTALPMPKCAETQVDPLRSPHWKVGDSGAEVDSIIVL